MYANVANRAELITTPGFDEPPPYADLFRVAQAMFACMATIEYESDDSDVGCPYCGSPTGRPHRDECPVAMIAHAYDELDQTLVGNVLCFLVHTLFQEIHDVPPQPQDRPLDTPLTPPGREPAA